MSFPLLKRECNDKVRKVQQKSFSFETSKFSLRKNFIFLSKTTKNQKLIKRYKNTAQ